jgi:hypothetical protein
MRLRITPLRAANMRQPRDEQSRGLGKTLKTQNAANGGESLSKFGGADGTRIRTTFDGSVSC